MFDFLTELLKDEAPPHDIDQPKADHVVCLQRILSKKYTLLLAYIAYGDQLRVYARDGVFEHFQEHFKEERDAIYQLNKKITALGGDADVAPAPVPRIPLDQPRAVFETLLSLELDVVQLWSELFHTSTEDVALNALAQDGALVDQQHADDMRRYLRSECGCQSTT